VKYFKNTELAKLYNVSEKSVRNWIIAAQKGKSDLQLYEADGKHWVANTTKNTALIETQVQKGKKFKNQRGFRIVSPRPEFYDLYSQKQVLDIISSLIVHHEIPLQYSYVDGGANYWDQYANRLSTERAPNALNMTIELLDIAADSIDRLTDGHRKVNIIDLGPGNGLPIRSTLSRILNQGRLNRYIAIDSSKEMLSILEQNIIRWFDGKVQFEGHVRDISYERFNDLLVTDFADDELNTPVNLVCLFGGTLSNFRAPDQVLQAINNSLGFNDLMLYSGYLDTPNSQRYFDFSTTRPNQKLRSELILGFLGIDESLYTIEQGFNEKERARYIRFIPRMNISIKFELPSGSRHVELQKSRPILLWRHWHKNTIEIINQLDRNDFDLMLTTKTKSSEYVLLVSKLKIFG
jgi:hypothetical protein